MADPAPEKRQHGSTAPTLSVEYSHGLADGRELNIQFSSNDRVVALTGPSGIGKTTTLDIVAGLLHPAQARIEVNGLILTDTEKKISLPAHERNIGYVPQDSLLFPLHTVKENLLFGRPDVGAHLAFEDIVERLGVTHLLHRKPQQLSGGERQRVALGRSVLSEPNLLLCDEPFSALDDDARESLMSTLEDIASTLNLPMLIVTHRLDDAKQLAQKVLKMEGEKKITAREIV
jgi:molybdate transport system ATP-binding protein